VNSSEASPAFAVNPTRYRALSSLQWKQNTALSTTAEEAAMKATPIKPIVKPALRLGLLLLLAATGHAVAGDVGDRVERRMDRHGERIDARLDHRGERIEARSDRRASVLAAQGHDRAAARVERHGERVEQRLDHRGDRIANRWEHRGERFDRRWDPHR